MKQILELSKNRTTQFDKSNCTGNYRNNPANLQLRLKNYTLDFSKRSLIMGILNLTPDSFSGDGAYSNLKQSGFNKKTAISKAVKLALKLVKDGADIIDLGGESSRPNAKPVPENEEIERVIPVLKKISKEINIPISVDTYKPEVARLALDNGATIINDITGLRNSSMRKIVATYKAGAIIMHMKSNPLVMQENPHYKSLIKEIIGYLSQSIKLACESGIEKEKLIIDPGIGFGKTTEHNLEILNRLEEFKILGVPIMIGTSRKSFIGNILGNKPEERIYGTLASVLAAILNGANIVRVHDCSQIRQSITIFEKINHYGNYN